MPKQLRCITSPHVNGLVQNGNLQRTLPHPNSVLISPFLKLFHWSLLVPDEIKYDSERGIFFCKKGSLLLKCLSYIWLLFLCIYLSLICFNDVSQPHTMKSVLSKMIWICYTLFDVTVIKCLRRNGDKIATLLTEGNRISWFCGGISGSSVEPPVRKRTRYLKSVILLTCALSVVFTVVFVLYVITELTAVTTNLYTIFMEFTSSGEKNGTVNPRNWNCQTVRCNLLERCMSSVSASILINFWLLMAFGIEVIWVVFLAMAASFGYYFKQLLGGCIHIIESNQVEMTEGIRIFNKITLVLEDFNALFGSTLLWIVIASVMYTALTLGEFLIGSTNEFMYDMLNAVGFLPFIVTLYTGSELHRIGQILPSFIKKQFLHLRITDQTQMLQVIQGTNVVHYDAVSNNIGMKGHGFFTISYNMVTSLVGVIITYSLVAMQFKVVNN